MEVRLDVKTHKVAGTQKLTYYNNSKDTLRRVLSPIFQRFPAREHDGRAFAQYS